ncbi:MAG: TonB-dependent hemoglobin/transferrin/lactoferrin family receptor [Gammaproteobacteria bacterium]|nr:TonB-dependent hemoglobin/transferrin/lactoferrin family receptor [Gammaproteobacteria bacterium]
MTPALLWLLATAPNADTTVAGPSDSEELPTITVTIGRGEIEQHQVPAPVSVIDRETLQQRQAANLHDVLRDLAGVGTEGGPRQAALQPNIRGLGEGRVVMRLDGARQNMNIRHRGQSFLDPALLERVEVWRGPASTLYGSGAIGGVVNFHTLDAAGLLSDERTLGGNFTAGYHDNGDQRFAAATLAATHEGFGLLGSLSRRRAGDFDDGDGNRVGLTGSDVFAGLLKGSWQGERDQRVTATYLGFDDDALSLATADRPEGLLVERNTRQHTGSLRYEYRPQADGLWDLDVTGYHTDLTLDERALASGSLQRNALVTTGLDAFNASRFSTGALEHRIAYGVEWYRDRQRGTEDGAPRPGFASSRQRTLGLFVQDSISFPGPLSATAGVRVDRISQRAERDDVEENALSQVSPQLALNWQVTDTVQLYASYAEAFRAPALRELFIGGQHFPGNQYLPNPQLRPEQARNHEVGLVFSDRGVFMADSTASLRLSVFRNDVDDFIEQIVAATTTRFENLDHARIRGIEFESRYSTEQWRLMTTLAIQRGDDRGRNEPLQSIPGDSLTALVARAWLDGALELGMRTALVRDQTRVPDRAFTIEPTPGHALLDVFARWSPQARLDVHLSANNLTNRTYRPHLSQLNARGRTLMLQLRHGF